MTFRARSSRVVRILALAAALAAVPWASPATAQSPVVHAVLFYSPTCPHCHEVINTHLPPLRERYGDRFVIVGVDVTTANGSVIYDAAVEYYRLAPDRLGVPLLVIGEVTLLGSLEIPAQLPGLIEEGLAAGGTAWPALPTLRQALAAQGLLAEEPAPAEEPLPAPDSPAAAQAPRSDAEVASEAAQATPPPGSPIPPVDITAPRNAPVTTTTDAEGDPAQVDDLATSFNADDPQRLSATQRFLQDPTANTIAVMALVVLVGVLVVGIVGVRDSGPRIPVAPRWVIPALALTGLAIAAYLSRVEITGAQAVCGPVGDCNTVQQSEFARLFGVPVGILGALGYLGILTAWGMAVAGPQGSRLRAGHVLWAFTLVGCTFSLYLTYLGKL